MHIYKWTHKESGKSYIGQSVQEPRRRVYEHTSGGHYFYNALNKYGLDAFDYEIIYWAESLDDLNDTEKRLIKEHKTLKPHGYNLREGGENRGRHHPDSIEKMRESQRKAHARRQVLGTDTWTRRDGGAMLGKQQSQHQKDIVAELALEKITCPHCGKPGQRIAMNRWHFDNCKEKTS